MLFRSIDLKTGLLRLLFERVAAKENAIETERGDGMWSHGSVAENVRHPVVAFHHPRRRGLVELVALTGKFECAAGEIARGMIPPAEPRIVRHVVRKPGVGEIINGRHMGIAQTEDERFGKAAQTEDVNDIGQEGGDGVAKRRVVVRDRKSVV